MPFQRGICGEHDQYLPVVILKMSKADVKTAENCVPVEEDTAGEPAGRVRK
jgi:hypothetical protein